jgi:hypothetical protein
VGSDTARAEEEFGGVAAVGDVTVTAGAVAGAVGGKETTTVAGAVAAA